MYIPKRFKVEDEKEIWTFLKQHTFATLVTTDKGRPIATHIPVIVKRTAEEIVVSGHLAKGNRQWRTLNEEQEALIIFQGPHAYISSSWYEEEQVPTWNYQSVHVYGNVIIQTQDELVDDLKMLLHTYEHHREHPVLWETLSPELLERELKGIVGFKLNVTDIQAAYKMSQNRNDKDYASIITQLHQESSADAHHVAQEMKKLR
ncbi:FMN-binding negative transcriptional regulator [Psychrobacillus sp. NPDC096623]|uniref:FMN-binding negative transcriptional regulator n=1 Tax=Psychrobacillus sp. NPDC096623 TaxID=3364492 RepID=UPI0038060F96